MSAPASLLLRLAAPCVALVAGVALVACAAGEPYGSSSAGFGVSGVPPVGSFTAGSSEGGGSSGAAEPTTVDVGSGASSTATTTGGALDTTAVGATTAASTGAGDETGDPCGGPCDAPGPCEEPGGACVAGECVYSPTAAEVACDDGDACTADDACDGAGGCHGAPIACERPHTSGGACVGGVCQGFQCVAPWSDCDADWDNGCEVPTGVANQCDANGLNAESGCWTAYCGALDDAKARNFGSYYCYDCPTCNTPMPGLWQWCNHTTGTWYPAEAGSCGASEDLVCAP